MKNVNTFMYKRLMPMFALMISTQAFAEEITYPFGHPFDDHLYNVEANEGMSLASLPNGKYYTKDSDPTQYDAIYGLTGKNGALPDESEFFPFLSNAITIKNKE